MAKKVQIELFDDLTGERIDTDIVPKPTVLFSIDGNDYEIDLGVGGQDKFYGKLKPYTAAARRVRSTRGTRQGGAATKDGVAKETQSAARKWAIEVGEPVSHRGRVPQAIVDKYLANKK
ncbi:Lsr2 family protein [Nocardia sp. NPDC051570]|uniref:Lsr2 family protein n=1 Tax=Nocardia sp. NPDC051570 TaxID=3364324 RepID=UPI0037B9E33C